MKVMVVGATGYVGARLVPLLIKEGHNVSCVVINPEKLLHKNWHNVEIIKLSLIHI